MGTLTKYGEGADQPPRTIGSVIYVGGGIASNLATNTYVWNGRVYVSSDTNSGIFPWAAKRTVNSAYAAAVDGDVIALFPGEHRLTAAPITLAKRLLWTSVTRDRPNAEPTQIIPLSTLGIVNTFEMTSGAAGSEFEFLHLDSSGAGDDGTEFAIFGSVAQDTYFHDCLFNVASLGARPFILAASATNMVIERCAFVCGAQPAVGAEYLQLGPSTQVLVEKCVISSGAISAFFASNTAGGADIFMRDNVIRSFGAAGALTSGLYNGTAADVATGVGLYRNRMTALVSAAPFDGFSAGECDINMNYEAQSAGSAGGNLVVVIT